MARNHTDLLDYLIVDTRQENKGRSKKNPPKIKGLALIKTKHDFHIVDPSPWPVFMAVGCLFMALGLTAYMHRVEGGWGLLVNGVLLTSVTLYTWFRDIIREGLYENQHTVKVRRMLRTGVALFIVTESMFFFSFFWAFAHLCLAPGLGVGGVWPPKGISVISPYGVPLSNTIVLISSGLPLTFAHKIFRLGSKYHTILGLVITISYAVLFSLLQGYEYVTATFSINDSAYGSCFYMITGLHGTHVLGGSFALLVTLARTSLNHFTLENCVGLDTTIWYWHFVDVVWIFVFFVVYCWGSSQG